MSVLVSARRSAQLRRQVSPTWAGPALLALAVIAALVFPGTAGAVSVPGVPQNVKATPSSSSKVHVTWSAVSGATSYVVSNGNVSSADVTTTSYDWGGLQPGTYMCFTVAAKNSAGQSAWSSYACATTPVPAPTGLSATPSITRVHLSWADGSGAGLFLVSNGEETVEVLGTSYDWAGLNVGKYMCFTVAAEQGDGVSPWTPYACTVTTTGDADRDSLIVALQSAVPSRIAMTDALGRSMDTAKILQINQVYYTVYSPGSQSVVLASAATLYSTWTPVVTLDGSAASQPYLAQMSDGFVLADEYATDPSTSALKFKHYPSLAALRAGQADREYQTRISLLGELNTRCHEGTPDIHSTDSNNIHVGLHYNAGCLSNQLDQQAFGTLTSFSSWTATKDTARDAALNGAQTPWTDPTSGYPGKHGGRDDVTWRGKRYSVGEAQRTGETSLYTNWRWSLYDYGNRTAYPIAMAAPSWCAGNPKITRLTDSTTGTLVLVVTGFTFGECAQPNQSGEFLTILQAQ
jgi:hypothetical protein